MQVKLGKIIGICGMAVVLSLSSPGHAQVRIEFDYTYDTTGFFNDQSRRDLMDLAADSVLRFTDTLLAINPDPGAGNEYLVFFTSPAGGFEFLSNPTAAEDVVTFYVGGKTGMGNTLALSHEVSWSASGDPIFVEDAETRGQSGASANPATDYGPFAGSIAFNSETDWHFGVAASTLGANDYDFLSVAMHEIAHGLGYGPADSHQALVQNNHFIGTEALAVGSPNNPTLEMDGTVGHWKQGTLSSVAGQSQVAAMEGYFNRGQRKRFTELDWAALRDIGWSEALAGDTQRDGDVDNDDIFQILGANSFNQGEGYGWSDGDNDADGDVDNDDVFNILATGAFNGGNPATAAEGDQPAAPLPVLELVILEDGTATMSTQGLTLNAIQIKSTGSDGLAGAGGDGYLSGAATLPASFFLINSVDEASSTFISVSGLLDFGQLIGDLSNFTADDLFVRYGIAGQTGDFNAVVTYVPEPACLAILASAGVVILGRRRR